MVYGAGQRDGQWGLEGLDFDTGESRVWIEAGSGDCSGESSNLASILPGVSEVLEQVPDSCENSVYAATTIGPDGTVYQGTLNGMTRYVPDAVEASSAASQAEAGVEQALDLLARSQSDAPSNISERDFLRRALVQLIATQSVALEAGLREAGSAVALAMEALDAAVTALDAGEPYDAYVETAREALVAL